MIRVGGATEIEVKESKDRVDDATHATRAAVEEGIVPGGGVALLYAAKALDGLTPENSDQRVGIDIVKRRCSRRSARSRKTPAPTARSSSASCWTANDPNRGFDAQTGEYVDMVKAGIIDPTKVVRLGLAERRFGRRSPGHDRGDGRRKAGKEDRSRNAARSRHGRHGRLLNRIT